MSPSTIPMTKMVCRRDKSCGIISQITPKFLLRNGPNGRSLSAVLLHDFSCQKAGLGIQSEHLLYRFQMSGWRCNHYFFDDPRNLLESDPLLQKRSHRDFVGGVQGDGLCASGRRRFVSQTETREFSHIRGAEIQLPQVHDREAQLRWDAIRIRQRIQNGQTHVGHRELSKYAAIHEFDQGMDRRLWMHNDLHAIGRDLEQAAGLDHLETLIHQCCRVYGDPSSHFPGGMTY